MTEFEMATHLRNKGYQVKPPSINNNPFWIVERSYNGMIQYSFRRTLLSKQVRNCAVKSERIAFIDVGKLEWENIYP